MRTKDNDRLKNKLIKAILIFGAFFLTTSILGTFLGNYLDNAFNIKPFGTLGILAIFYIATWVLVIFFVKDINKTAKKSKK